MVFLISSQKIYDVGTHYVSLKAILMSTNNIYIGREENHHKWSSNIPFYLEACITELQIQIAKERTQENDVIYSLSLKAYSWSMQTAKALIRLRRCAGSHEFLLFTYKLFTNPLLLGTFCFILKASVRRWYELTGLMQTFHNKKQYIYWIMIK